MSGDHTKYHGTAEVPKREWVGLDMDDIHQIWTHTYHLEEEDVQEVAHLIEAKLKEKNA